MRVASIAFTNYDADPRVRRMSEALAERGDDVTAITLRQPAGPMRRTLAGVDVYGIDIKQYKGSSIVSYLGQYVRFLVAASWLLTKLHARRRFDIVHVNNMPDFLVFAALPARLFGAKVILDLHDPMPELYAAKFGGNRSHPAVRVVTGIERLSIAFADRAIGVQQTHIDTFVAHGNPRSKFVEVQNAADTRLFPVGAALDHVKASDRVRIIYHGTMAPRLGLHTLLYATEILRVDHPEVEVVLIGDGEDSDRIEAIIAERHLEETVRFDRGFIPVNELLPELEQAEIGVVPAGQDPFTEGMLPSKLLEYVTLGIPTACADLHAVRRYFDDDAIAYFPPGDHQSLATVLAGLVDDPIERRQRAKRAMVFLDDHSWPQERQRYFHLADELFGLKTLGRTP